MFFKQKLYYGIPIRTLESIIFRLFFNLAKKKFETDSKNSLINYN